MKAPLRFGVEGLAPWLFILLALMLGPGQAQGAQAQGPDARGRQTHASASSVALLKQWVRETRSAKAEFAQTVVDEKSKLVSASSGSFEFERPDKFRWVYAKPYHQDIVSDGQTIWTYDHDLNQVTISPQSRALSGTPAALLAGEDIERLFVLTPMPTERGLQWVQAVPRAKESSFQWVRIGLESTPQGPELAQMALRDAFGRTSTIVFSDFRRNPPFQPGNFHFEAPRGAAVIQQP